ncbi:DUF4382 domain-containing protein [Haoranjiania flava]|uniref:DUF4382 domain-containing protein n=1 Tax=Haoranjiania flava TaxID=1856322 RepID=A0AAE3IJM1_9BACT|nr:DUF4382 domain-containing protein [Haoranjiania flava]MCU7693003.1 DUF4382 domain-containing protein [Haoranjiania flava]
MKKTLCALAALVSLGAISCTKNNGIDHSAATSTVSIALTDAPALYEAVYIDIREISVGVDTAWRTLNYTPQLYNLLDLRNGQEAMMGRVQVPSGDLNQIRLLLGDNSYVVADGMKHPLKVPSGESSGLKLKLNKTLEPGVAYKIWIDFDAAGSIVQTGNDQYILKPVVRTFSEETNGQIWGKVLPAEAQALVKIAREGSTDTLTAIPFADGTYKFIGLQDGTYHIVYDANQSTLYKDSTKTNVGVTYGKITDLGTMILVK